jgi:hypothetical protein
MRRLSAALLLLVTAACASDGDISERIDFCCGPKDAALTTYTISAPKVPPFLLVPLGSQLVDALTAKGWRQVDKNPDALVTMTYSAFYPDSERPLANDGFSDPLSVGGPRKFDARVTIDIRRASDSAQILRGSMSREHREAVGEYGHERARAAIRAAFNDLLKRLPAVRKAA